LTFDGNPFSKIGVRFVEPIAGGVDLGGACEVGHGYFCNVTDLESTVEPELETSLIDSLFEVVHSESTSAPFILFIKDAAETILRNGYPFSFGTKLQALPNNVVVIGSHTLTDNDTKKDILVRFHDEGWELSNRKLISKNFLPNEITVSIQHHKSRKCLDIETHTIKRNVHQLRIVLRHYKLECEGLETMCIKDQILSSECANKIVGWAVSYHLMQMQNPNPESTIVLSQESINHGFGILQSSQSEPQNMRRSQKDIVAENEFEASLLANVIPPSETGVTFDDIGALEAVKDTLKELIMLPLKRPELFRKAKLTKPVL
jgi:hypothetical protein